MQDLFIDFLKEDTGEEVILFEDKGFASVSFEETTGELFVHKLYLSEGHRGLKNVHSISKILDKKAKELGAWCLVCKVFLNLKGSREFSKKIALYEYFGFTVKSVEYAVTLIKEL